MTFNPADIPVRRMFTLELNFFEKYKGRSIPVTLFLIEGTGRREITITDRYIDKKTGYIYYKTNMGTWSAFSIITRSELPESRLYIDLLAAYHHGHYV